MMAAVLYGKEHLQVEPVAVPTIDERRHPGAGEGGADLRHRRQGLPPRISCPHDRAPRCVRARTGRRCCRGGRGCQPVSRLATARGGGQFGALRDCYLLPARPENLCEDLLFNNGAYAEYIRIPARIVERNTYRIPAHVSYQDAALVEPLACVVRGLEETAPRPGDTHRHHRPGPHRADVRQTGQAVRLPRDRGRPAQARNWSARRRWARTNWCVAGEHSNPVEHVRDLTDGRGVDIAIEAVGKPRDLAMGGRTWCAAAARSTSSAAAPTTAR